MIICSKWGYTFFTLVSSLQKEARFKRLQKVVPAATSIFAVLSFLFSMCCSSLFNNLILVQSSGPPLIAGLMSERPTAQVLGLGSILGAAISGRLCEKKENHPIGHYGEWEHARPWEKMCTEAADSSETCLTSLNSFLSQFRPLL